MMIGDFIHPNSRDTLPTVYIIRLSKEKRAAAAQAEERVLVDDRHFRLPSIIFDFECSSL
jgi:hypothetical protein